MRRQYGVLNGTTMSLLTSKLNGSKTLMQKDVFLLGGTSDVNLHLKVFEPFHDLSTQTMRLIDIYEASSYSQTLQAVRWKNKHFEGCRKQTLLY